MGPEVWKAAFNVAIVVSAASFVGVALQRAKVTHIANTVPRMCPSGRLENETARYIFWSQTPDPRTDPWRIVGLAFACLASVLYIVSLVITVREEAPWNAEEEATIATWAKFLVFTILFPIGTLLGLQLAGWLYTPQFYADSHGRGKISAKYDELKDRMRQMTPPSALARELADRWLLHHVDEKRTEGDAQAALRRAFSASTEDAAVRARAEVIGLLSPMRDLRYRGVSEYNTTQDGQTKTDHSKQFFDVLKELADENAFDPRPPIDYTSAILFSIAWRVALLTTIILFYNFFKK